MEDSNLNMASYLVKSVDTKGSPGALFKVKEPTLYQNKEWLRTPLRLSLVEKDNPCGSKLALNLSAQGAMDETQNIIQTARSGIKPKENGLKANCVAAKILIWAANAARLSGEQNKKEIEDKHDKRGVTDGDYSIQAEKQHKRAKQDKPDTGMVHQGSPNCTSKLQNKICYPDSSEGELNPAPWKVVSHGKSRRHIDSRGGIAISRTNLLEVKKPHAYSGTRAILMQPQVLGSFSCDSQGNFGYDNSMLHTIDRFYLPRGERKKVYLDLKEGLEKLIQYNRTGKEKFHHVLQWILENKDSLLLPSSKRLSVDFVSEVGNLSRIMRTPYSLPVGWAVLAVEFNGTIYISNCSRKNTVNCGKNGAQVTTNVRWKEMSNQSCTNAGGNINRRQETYQANALVIERKMGGQTNAEVDLRDQQNQIKTKIGCREKQDQTNTNGSRRKEGNQNNKGISSWDKGSYTPSYINWRETGNQNRTSTIWPVRECLVTTIKHNRDEISRWGFMFKHYIRGYPAIRVNPNEKYHCVLKTLIGDNSLIYAPDVDCADPFKFRDGFTNMEAFVSLRSCRNNERGINRNHMGVKLNQWWIENRLTGIPRMLIGYRNDTGIVETLEILKTDDMPLKAQGEWTPSVCFNFLDLFLKFLKDRVRENPGTTLMFEYEPKGNIHCRTVDGTKDILPKWYTKKL